MGECKIAFNPGPMGVTKEHATGIIEKVDNESQANRAGVQAGWVIAKVNGEDYTQAILERAIQMKQPYEITFALQKENKNANSAVVPDGSLSTPAAAAVSKPTGARSAPAATAEPKQTGATLTAKALRKHDKGSK